MAPIVRVADGERQLELMRWGMPGPPLGGGGRRAGFDQASVGIKKSPVDQMTSFSDRINETLITGEQMARANKIGSIAIRKARGAGKAADLMTAVFSIMHEFGHEITPVKVSAIMFRMQALAQVIDDRSAENWTVEIKGKREVFIQAAVYEAAAKARLDLAGDQPAFDREEFLALVLRYSGAEGRA